MMMTDIEAHAAIKMPEFKNFPLPAVVQEKMAFTAAAAVIDIAYDFGVDFVLDALRLNGFKTSGG